MKGPPHGHHVDEHEAQDEASVHFRAHPPPVSIQGQPTSSDEEGQIGDEARRQRLL